MVFYEPFELCLVISVLARYDDEMHLLEAMHEGEQLIGGAAEMDVGPRQRSPCQEEHHLLILGEPELCACGFAVVFPSEVRGSGDARYADALLGHLSWAQRFRHMLVGDTEDIRMQMRPQTLHLIISGYADDGECLAQDHAGADRYIRCCDMGADDGIGLLLIHVFHELRIHDACPDGASGPEQSAGERVAPSQVIVGTGDTGEHGGRIIAVEDDAPELQDIQHFRMDGTPVASFGIYDLERISNGVGGRAVA